MKILCDTSSVLLLIRSAPQMFIDDRFNCFTVREVWEEVFRTQKFKAKYSWRDSFKNKIKVTSSLEIAESLRSHLELIQNLVETGIINSKTGRFFDLSRKDQKIVANVLAFDSKLSTNDFDMRDFVNLQFNGRSLSSLALLNEWLENNLIAFDSKLQQTIEDWAINNEPVQPRDDIEKFERLTGREYVGPR